jgi:hypothetical protein
VVVDVDVAGVITVGHDHGHVHDVHLHPPAKGFRRTRG